MSVGTGHSSRSKELVMKGTGRNVGSTTGSQPKVTSFFPTIRRGKSAGKRMKIEVPASIKSPVKKEISEDVLVPLDDAEISFDFTKIASKNYTSREFVGEITSDPEVSSIPKDSSEVMTECAEPSRSCVISKQRIESKQDRKSVKRRLLFPDDEPLSTKPSVSGDSENKIKPTGDGDADVKFVSSRIVRYAKKGKRGGAKTVTELQERLASKGVATSIHTQNLDFRSTKVLDGKAALISSKKTVLLPLKAAKSPVKQVRVLEKLQISPLKLNKNEYITTNDCEESGMEDGLKYGRASLLKQVVKESSLLILPKKYDHLHKLFENVDQIVSIYQGRDMRIPLNLVISNMAAASKKKCTVKDFAQMVFLYPSAYIVRVEECKVQISGFEGRFEYIIEPNLVDDIKGYMERDLSPVKTNVSIQPPPFTSPCKGRMVASPRKTPAKVPPLPRTPALDLRTRLEGWRRIVRNCIFKHCLVEFIRKNNPELADKLRTSVKSADGVQVADTFELEDELFADIPEGGLPELPKGDESLQKNVRDYLSAVEDSYNTLPGSLQDAINLLRSPQSKTACVLGRQVPLSPRKYAAENAGKSNLSLLERIRAKELEKKRLLALRDPEKERKRRRLQELLIYVRDLCRLFTFCRVSSMPLSKLSQKLVDGSARSSKNEVEAQIILLTDVAKEFFELRVVAEVKYISIKQNSPAELLAVLKGELKKCD